MKQREVILVLAVALVVFCGGGPDRVLAGGEAPGETLRADSLNVHLVGRWGDATAYSVAIDSVRHIAFLGSSENVYAIDIGNPSAPVLLGQAATGGMTMDLHYENGYLYVADLFDGLRIISVDDPALPQELGFFDTAGFVWGVDVEGDIATLACGNTGLIVVSVTDPSLPVQVGASPSIGYATSLVQQDTLLAIADNGGSLRMFSIQDPANPREIGSSPVPGAPWGVAIVDQLLYIAAGGSGLRVMTIEDPQNPGELSFFDVQGYARKVVVHTPHAYMAAGGSGLRIIDTGAVQSPLEVGYYDTDGYTWGVEESDSLIYLADGDGGLLILEMTGTLPVDDPDDDGPSLPRIVSLAQNYPNPFNPATTISFTVPGQGATRVALIVHDTRGRLVRTLVDDTLAPGQRAVVWDGRNERGEKVPSGIYLYTVRCGGTTISRKMTMVK